MERILNLQKLSESAYGAAGDRISTISMMCSEESNACSTATNGCLTTDQPTIDTGTAIYW